MISLKLNCLLEQKSIAFIGMNQMTQCLIYSKKLLDMRGRKLNPWTRYKKKKKVAINRDFPDGPEVRFRRQRLESHHYKCVQQLEGKIYQIRTCTE